MAQRKRNIPRVDPTKITHIDDNLAPMRPLKSFPASQAGLVEVMLETSRKTRFEMCVRSMNAQKSQFAIITNASRPRIDELSLVFGWLSEIGDFCAPSPRLLTRLRNL